MRRSWSRRAEFIAPSLSVSLAIVHAALANSRRSGGVDRRDPCPTHTLEAAMPKHVETAPEYVQRILSNVEGKDPLQVLGATAGRLRAIVRDTPLERLRRKPAPDK